MAKKYFRISIQNTNLLIGSKPIKFQLQKMYNNDKVLQLYAPKQLSAAILQWLDQEVHEVYTSAKKKINLSIVANDLFSQPFLAKFMLKVNYDFFSKTQLMDFIDSTVLRKLDNRQRKSKFLSFIEKYLHSQERRKFTQAYKNYMLGTKSDADNQKSSQQVIRLLLFMAIRSQNKNQFIERIFSMETQTQQNLMDELMEVENILENITQKQELVLQFNNLKQLNLKMKNNYQDLIDYQNKLLDQCQKEDFTKNTFLEKNQQNRDQKIQICEALGIDQVQKPYLKIYKKLQDKNATLTRILIQKQKKQNELLEQHNSLKQKSDEFEQVLYELNQQKKKLKVVLNNKKNESFQLEMRASLRLSQEKQNLRRSQALRRKSLANYKTALKQTTNNMLMLSNKNNKLGTNSKHDQYSNINQSVNILAKIQELRLQKQSMKQELATVKIENQKLKQKDSSDKEAFSELKQIYSQFLALCPEYVESKRALHKQKSKSNFKTSNTRYL